jgi:engulfment and cell motility protein 1
VVRHRCTFGGADAPTASFASVEISAPCERHICLSYIVPFLIAGDNVQDNSMKYLHYVDSALKFAVRNGLEDLPDRIDVALIHEIATGTGLAPPNVVPGLDGGGTALSFSLMNTDQGSLADLIAPDQLRWADWTDGLNMLRRDGGHVASSETEGYVKALTEIGLKIKLLGECLK